MAKNPTSQNFYSPVDPTILISSVGSTGDKRKNPAGAELVFHSPRPLENLTIGGSKQVQRGSNFAGTITKIL